MFDLRPIIKECDQDGTLIKHFPEIHALKRIKQGIHHQEGDVFTHTLMVLDAAKKTPLIQWAALLHDVGKPATCNIMGSKITFYSHDIIGASVARRLLNRMNFEYGFVNDVCYLVEHHMKPHFLIHNFSKAALINFMKRHDPNLIEDLLDLAEADTIGRIPSDNQIPWLRDKIKNTKIPPPPPPRSNILNGHEIMSILNIGPGPIVGKVQEFLHNEAVFCKSTAIKLVKECFT